MKKIAFLFLLVFAVAAQAQVNQQVDCRLRDATNPTTRAAVGAATGSTFAVSIIGLTVKSANYFYNGSAWAPMIPPWGTGSLSSATNCVAMDTVGTEITIVPGWHKIKAISNSACLLSGAVGVLASLTCGAGTMGYQLSEGERLEIYIPDVRLAVKAPTSVTGDLLCVIRIY
ncbi:MAG: hypothetical protein WC444_04970 [Candidatus Paceibacterota bacterium]